MDKNNNISLPSRVYHRNVHLTWENQLIQFSILRCWGKKLHDHKEKALEHATTVYGIFLKLSENSNKQKRTALIWSADSIYTWATSYLTVKIKSIPRESKIRPEFQLSLQFIKGSTIKQEGKKNK